MLVEMAVWYELGRNDVWTSLIKRTKGRGLLVLRVIYRTRRTRYPAPDVVRMAGVPRGEYRSVRKEPNKERKVGLIGCRRRNLVVSICHSLARERDPSRFPLFSGSISIFPRVSIKPLRFNTLIHSRGIYLWIRRSHRSARTLAGYYENSGAPSNPPWNSIHVSRRSRQKSHDCRRDPLLVGARFPCTSYPDWDSRDLID